VLLITYLITKTYFKFLGCRKLNSD